MEKQWCNFSSEKHRNWTERNSRDCRTGIVASFMIPARVPPHWPPLRRRVPEEAPFRQTAGPGEGHYDLGGRHEGAAEHHGSEPHPLTEPGPRLSRSLRCAGRPDGFFNRGVGRFISVALRSLPRLKTPMRARMESAGRVAEWFKAAVLKTARARKGPRGFESHPFRQLSSKYLIPPSTQLPPPLHTPLSIPTSLEASRLAAIAHPRDDRRVMELDSYWCTRAIAEAQSQGYTHLRVTCAGCGRVTDMPSLMLLDRFTAGHARELYRKPVAALPKVRHRDAD